ncbi:MAG: lactate racemase domain-containing protein [Syntrophorhabdales bacterium]|jgi:nickel-dependent lactate racemase
MKASKEIIADYWDKKITISVPKDTVVPVVPPPALLEKPDVAVKKALENPVGAPPLLELARKAKGKRVVIAHDDLTRPALPRRIMIPIIMEVLNKAGVKDEDVFLVSANGNHCKWPDTSFRAYFGDEIYNRFRPMGSASRLLNHDCHDLRNLKYMGVSELGDYVEYNNLLDEAALFIYCGTVLPSNWGGMTGTGVIIGLASSRSMVSTHGLPVVGHEESCHGDHRTMLYRKHKEAVMKQIEKAIGKRVFYVDGVLGAGAQLAGIFAGYSPEINEPTWSLTEKLYRVEVPQADVFVLGVPRVGLYGETSNPLIGLAATCTPPRIWVNKPILREGGVVIALTRCTGNIDDNAHASYREVINLFRRCHSSYELQKYEEEFLYREDLIFKYQRCHSYAPIHPFWLFYESQYMLDHASKIIFAGVPTAEVPIAPPQIEGTGGAGAARDMGCVPAVNFEEAWKMAEKIVGRNPTVVACPQFWTTVRPQFHVK